MNAGRLVLIGLTRALVEHELRELTIPVRTLRAVTITSVEQQDLERNIRGLGDHIWATVPGYSLTDSVRCFVLAHRGRELSFHEALVRHLAWRIWHDGA